MCVKSASCLLVLTMHVAAKLFSEPSLKSAQDISRECDCRASPALRTSRRRSWARSPAAAAERPLLPDAVLAILALAPGARPEPQRRRPRGPTASAASPGSPPTPLIVNALKLFEHCWSKCSRVARRVSPSWRKSSGSHRQGSARGRRPETPAAATGSQRIKLGRIRTTDVRAKFGRIWRASTKSG